MNHAILIMAYDRDDNVRLLTDILNKGGFKVYCHWDFKNPIPNSLKSHPNLTLIKNRTACCWGDLSIGTAAYVSMCQIFKDDIDTVTVISGNDFPCMNLNKMHELLDSLDSSLVQYDVSPGKFLRGDIISPVTSSGSTHTNKFVQKVFGHKTERYNLPFPLHEAVGPNWCTIRKVDFTKIRVSVVKYPNLIHALNLTMNSDENLFQALFKITNLKLAYARRFTIWTDWGAHPEELHEDDILKLLKDENNVHIFARKIDPSSIPTESEVYRLLYTA